MLDFILLFSMNQNENFRGIILHSLIPLCKMVPLKFSCRERENRGYKESKTGGKKGSEEENKQRGIQVEGNTSRGKYMQGEI